jgi:malate dehydrogenase
MTKISVVGVGNVGSCIAFLLAQKNICDELVLVDIRTEWAVGQAYDIGQSEAFANDCNVHAGNLEAIAGSDLVMISAGKARTPDIKTRRDLAFTNGAIMHAICPIVGKTCPDAVVVTLTNPMDAMNYLVWCLTGLPRERIVGTGGMLDTCRARWILGDGIPTTVDITLLGEHGDGQTPVFSRARKNGTPLLLTAEAKHELCERLRLSSMEVVKRKEATVFAPATHTVSMIEAILQDRNVTMPCSAVLQGEYGLEGLSIGVPVVLGRGGIQKILEWDLDAFERDRFYNGARAVQELCAHVLSASVASPVIQ